MALTLSVFLKLPPRKLEFNEVSPEVAVYLYKSAIAYVWNTVVMSGLVHLFTTWNC